MIRIWDSLLADPERFNYLNYLCVAMVKHLRETLLEGDFADCMQALQKFPEHVNIRDLLNDANQLLIENQRYNNFLGPHY